MTEISDRISSYTEYSLCEDKSSRLIADTLRDYGLEVKFGVAEMPTAILAEYSKGKKLMGKV